MILYGGIDPGATGGIGIVDQNGQFVAAHRWDKKDPAKLYNILSLIRDQISIIYLENVNLPSTGAGIDNQFSSGSNLLINTGIWQGFLIALSLTFIQIAPASWQAPVGLFHWKSKQAKKIPCHSPLTLARELWPAAPLSCKIDDGKACALILADLARRDQANGIDRAAIQAQATTKKIQAKARKKAKNALNPKNQPHQSPQAAR